MPSSPSAENPRRSPESVDRLLVVGCGVIWLILLVVAVIASVALVNLGRGDSAGEQSPWLLYTVIVVSALTILGAIPLLLRARRDAGEPDEPPAQSPPPLPAPGEMRVFGTAVDPRRSALSASESRESPVVAGVERVLLRGTVSLVGAAGLALIGVAAATYLLTVGNDTAATAVLGVAAAVTVAMPILAVIANRKLSAAVNVGG